MSSFSPTKNAFSLVLLCLFGYFSGLQGQSLSFADRYGTVYDYTELQFTENPNPACDCEEFSDLSTGVFRLYFAEVADNTGTGFASASKGAALRRSVCAAYAALNDVLQPAAPLCVAESPSRINVRVSSLPETQEEARSSAYYSLAQGYDGRLFGAPWWVFHTGSAPKGMAGDVFHAYLEVNTGNTLSAGSFPVESSSGLSQEELGGWLLHQALAGLGITSVFLNAQPLLHPHTSRPLFLELDPLLVSTEGTSPKPLLLPPLTEGADRQRWTLNDAIATAAPENVSIRAENATVPLLAATELSRAQMQQGQFPLLQTEAGRMGLSPLALNLLSKLGYALQCGAVEATVACGQTPAVAVDDFINSDCFAGNREDFILRLPPNEEGTLVIDFQTLLANDRGVGGMQAVRHLSGAGKLEVDEAAGKLSYTTRQLGRSDFLYTPIFSNGEVGNSVRFLINTVLNTSGGFVLNCEPLEPCEPGEECWIVDDCTDTNFQCEQLLCNPQFCGKIADFNFFPLDYCPPSNTLGGTISEPNVDLIYHRADVPNWIRVGASPDYFRATTDDMRGGAAVFASSPVDPTDIPGYQNGNKESLMTYYDFSPDKCYFFSLLWGPARPIHPETGQICNQAISSLAVELVEGEAIVPGGNTTSINQVNWDEGFLTNNSTAPTQGIIVHDNLPLPVGEAEDRVGTFFSPWSELHSALIVGSQNTARLYFYVDDLELIEDNFTAGADQTLSSCDEPVVLGAPFCMLRGVAVQYTWYEVGNPTALVTYVVQDGQVTAVSTEAVLPNVFSTATHQLSVYPTANTTYRLERTIVDHAGMPELNFCKPLEDGTEECFNEDSVNVTVDIPVIDPNIVAVPMGCGRYLFSVSHPEYLTSFTTGGQSISLGEAVTFPVGEFTVLATFVDDCGAIYERAYTGTVVPTILEPALAAEVLACGQVNFTLSGELGNNNEPVFYYGDNANSSGTAASFNYVDYQPGMTVTALVQLQECGVTATAAATFTFPAPQWSVVAGDCGLVSVNVVDPAGYALQGVDYTGDGQFTPALSYTFTEDGEYPLTLQWADACENVFVFTESITVDVPAVPSPTIEAQVGACGAVNFVVAGLGTDYQIYYGYPDATTSGTDLTYVYPACGSYKVRLQTSTCGQTAEAFVTINLACPGYSVSTEECGQVSLSLELPAEYVLHSIDYGDGAPASNSLLHTYTANGSYTIVPTVENTCTAALTDLSAQTVTILLPATPDAAFTSAEVSCGLYNFVATENGPQITHQWIINGMIHPNTTASLSNINLVNNTANTIEHTVLGACTSATSTMAIRPECIVCPPLQPGISVHEMECLAVTFSIDLSGGTVWNINYGDGNTGNTSTHSYENYGTYTVLLTVKNDCGELAEVPLNLTLTAPVLTPAISIANQSCRSLTFAVAPDDLAYSIDYGDGQSGTALVHTYADDLLSAVATVNYEVCGLPFSASTSVDFPVLPSLTTALSSCGELSVILADLGTAEILSISYGDGTPPTSELEHTYAAAGTYLVAVAIQTKTCGLITLTEEVTVELPPPPTATFSLTVDECGLIQITDLVTDEEVVSYCFSFEGGACSAENLSYQALTEGNYEVVMELTGACSITQVVVEAIAVTLPPAPVATPVTVGNNTCGRYTFQVTSPSEPGLQYEWIFPDGTSVLATDNDQVMYRFLYTRLYEVLLKVTDPDCGFLSATYSLNVYPVIAHALPLVVDESTDCLNAALFVDFLPVEVSDLQWFIPGGTISNTTTNGVAVTFPATGIYDYTLSYLDHCDDEQQLSGQVAVEECLHQDPEHVYGRTTSNAARIASETRAKTTGVQPKEGAEISVYPNPVQDVLYLQGPLETASNWRLVNGVGQTVFERASISGEKFALSIKAFPAGTYTLLYLDKGAQIHSMRIVVLPY